MVATREIRRERGREDLRKSAKAARPRAERGMVKEASQRMRWKAMMFGEMRKGMANQRGMRRDLANQRRPMAVREAQRRPRRMTRVKGLWVRRRRS